jgi:hypothetical protein
MFRVQFGRQDFMVKSGAESQFCEYDPTGVKAVVVRKQFSLSIWLSHSLRFKCHAYRCTLAERKGKGYTLFWRTFQRKNSESPNSSIHGMILHQRIQAHLKSINHQL